MGYIPEVEQEYRRYNRKEKTRRTVWIVVASLVGVLLLTAGYLAYDRHRDVKASELVINRQSLEQSFSRLSDDVIELEPVAFDYQKGNRRASVHVSVSDANQSLKDTICPKCAQAGRQRHIDLRATHDGELLFHEIRYMPLYRRLMSALNLERKDYGNLYLSYYGEELAKTKPNYPYMIELSIQKGDRNYAVRCFASNIDFVDEIIDELANHCPIEK